MTNEKEWDFDDAETITIVCAVLIVVVFLIFRFRIINFACFSENDSIAYVPSMAAFSICDTYDLQDIILRLRSTPPIISLVAKGSHISEFDDPEDPERGKFTQEVTSFVEERDVQYENWRDATEPIVFPKAYLLDLIVNIQYDLSPEVEDLITAERIQYIEDTNNRDKNVDITMSITSPGYNQHFITTTRGSLPGFVSWMGSMGGARLRDILMFFGYHSVLEAIWMCMIRKHEILIRKQISMEKNEDWTPLGMSEFFDYHNIPFIK